MNDVIKELKKQKIEYRENLKSKDLSFYKGGGELALAVYPKTIGELEKISEIIAKYEMNYTVIGGFSNTLIKDSGYGGLAVMTSNFKGVSVEDTVIKAGAAERLPRLAFLAFGHSLSGLECFNGIPATLGGAVYMNAGAYGMEICKIILSVSCYDLKTRRTETYKAGEINWGYRTSGNTFDDKVIICAELGLTKGSAEDIEAKTCLLRRMRTAAQPSGPSLGSVFKNPGGVGAGYYIDRCGLKGFTFNGAAISEKHANFIVNTGGGTADDFLALMELAKTSVARKFGVELESEIKILG